MISRNRTEASYNEIINEMIVSAWYSVLEYHVHLSGIRGDGTCRASRELYRKGNTESEFYTILEKNMRPVYDSAYRQGYEMWMI